LDDRELVSLVGGGGKSTLLFALGRELAAAGSRTVMTTTTKMGRDQALAAPTVCWEADTICAAKALEKPGPVMLVAGGDHHKVTGPSPEVVDRVFAAATASFVLVEADGSQGRPLKAPAGFEPVVPSQTTTVVILMGIDAVGRPIADVAHRVEVACRFSGHGPDRLVTVEDCARILLHPEGALRTCPPGAKVRIAVTKVRSPADKEAASQLAALVAETHPEIDTVVIPEP
jgi:probable selenium-dependent hydroxylase accessory protein YqeC